MVDHGTLTENLKAGFTAEELSAAYFKLKEAWPGLPEVKETSTPSNATMSITSPEPKSGLITSPGTTVAVHPDPQ